MEPMHLICSLYQSNFKIKVDIMTSRCHATFKKMNSKMHEHTSLVRFSRPRKRGETCPNYQQAMKLNSKTF